MAKPSRLPSASASQTYFITSSTWQKRALFQSEQLAQLFLRCLFDYRDQHSFQLQAFVLMPNHFHLLLTPAPAVTIEKAMQLIKGGFSHRAKDLVGPNTEIWQRGFTDRRVRNVEEMQGFLRYIHTNPVAAKFAATPESYPYSSAFPGVLLDRWPPYLGG
jgi:putative transposase